MPLIATGRIFFALGLIGMGATHFEFGDFMTGRAPPWPEQRAGGTAWAWTSGVVFICCGVAILVGRAMRVAALVTALLIIGWAFVRNIPFAAAARSSAASGPASARHGHSQAARSQWPLVRHASRVCVADWTAC